MTLFLTDCWQAVLHQVENELPRPVFRTRLSQSRLLGVTEEGQAVIGVPDPETRDWLENRLGNFLAQRLAGRLNRPVTVCFQVLDAALAEEAPSPEEQAEVEIVQRLPYEAVVAPGRVVAVPGYFARLIPDLGARNAWLYLGWRQAVWEGERNALEPSRTRSIPTRRVIRFSGLSRRAFFRAVAAQQTWQSLTGLVERIESQPRWQPGRDRRMHRAPNPYRVHMTLPLARADQASLLAFLQARLADGHTLLQALQQASQERHLVGELLPPLGLSGEGGQAGQTVMDMVGQLHGRPLPEALQRAAEAVHQRILGSFGTILVTHYFLETVIPGSGLTPAQAWLVTLLRDRCYLNQQSGERRDQVLVRGGYAELARWLGLSRPKTLWEWLRDPQNPLADFVEVLPGRPQDEADSLRLRVRLEEPLLAQPALSDGADGTCGVAQVAPMTGANVTDDWRNRHRIKPLSTSMQHAEEPIQPAPARWSLGSLLAHNHAHPGISRELLARQGSAQALVSWLLYGCSPAGAGLRNPFAHALTCLREDPQRGAGGAFDRLAALPPARLLDLLARAPRDRLSARSTRSANPDWEAAMGRANPELKTLERMLLGEEPL